MVWHIIPLDGDGDDALGDDWALPVAQNLNTLGARWGVRAARETDIAHASSTTIGVTFESASFENPDGWITPPGATLTVPAGEGGLYSLTAQAEYAASFTGAYGFLFTITGLASQWLGSIPNAASPTATLIRPLAAGNTISMGLFQSSASSQTLIRASLEVLRIGQ